MPQEGRSLSIGQIFLADFQVKGRLGTQRGKIELKGQPEIIWITELMIRKQIHCGRKHAFIHFMPLFHYILANAPTTIFKVNTRQSLHYHLFLN